MKNVLITGATGFIGKELLAKLFDQSLKIRVLTRSTDALRFFNHNIDIVTGDITDPNSLRDCCEGIDTVFHLAGYAHAWEEVDSAFAKHHHAVNYQGTYHLLEEAKKAGVERFVFFSTVKAVADSNETMDENWSEFPQSPYGIAKRQAEQTVLAAQDSMHVCVLRPALVYGPGWKGNLASMLRAVQRGIFPPLSSAISNNRSMISVYDICDAALLVATHPVARGKIYFVTDGVSYSTYDLYAAMCYACEKNPSRLAIPLWGFQCLAWVGDQGKKIFKRRMPFDSNALKKMFGSAHYLSHRIENELGFKATYQFSTLLPMIIAQQNSS